MKFASSRAKAPAESRRRLRALCGLVASGVALLCSAPLAARAQALPEQLIFEPVQPPQPIELGRTAFELSLYGYDLPDARRAEDYRLRAWWRPRERQYLAVELHYVGIEDSEHLIYAGGPIGLQWSFDHWRLAGLLWASDVSARLPMGDGAFHPLSAKAPSLEWNLRAGLSSEGGARLWAGWWMRRVSQPRDRVDPQSFFPSGSGATVYGSFDVGRTVVHAVARQDLGGASGELWLEGGLDYRINGELTLGAGFSVQAADESADERLFDRGWTLSVRWHPAPLPPE